MHIFPVILLICSRKKSQPDLKRKNTTYRFGGGRPASNLKKTFHIQYANINNAVLSTYSFICSPSPRPVVI